MLPDNERLQIRKELAQLRKNGAHRQELSLHACKRLFFDFGVRPSMSTVRDLTQTGSASDIPKDIDLFWQHLRTTSKTRIAAGAIPVELEEKAGALFGQMFDMALAQAHQMLEHEREKIQKMQQEADRSAHDADIRRIAVNEMLQRSEARMETALNQARELETQLTVNAAQHVLQQNQLADHVQQLEAKNSTLQKHLNTEQASNAVLHGRIDTLHENLRSSTEHYAQQIKDAMAQAERRVKPMLVELDSLRSQASAWQTSQRDMERREFDLLGQLTAARTRNDQLDAVLRERMDEVEALTRQIDTFRTRQAVHPVVTEVLCSLAASGRFRDEDFESIGTLLDDQVTLPSHCPHCGASEPDLSLAGHEYEISCPACSYSSGPCPSRLKAVAHFISQNSSASAVPGQK